MKVIIVGAGEVGFHIAQKLASENKDVVVIDRDAAALKRVFEYLDVQCIEGSGSNPYILQRAGIDNADVMLAVTDSDETNIIASMFTSSLSPNITKLVRIRNADYIRFQEDLRLTRLERGEKTLTTPGLDFGKIINPDEEVVKSIERLINFPQAEEINEFADGRVKLVGVRAKSGQLIDKNMVQVREIIGYDIGFVIAAIVRGDKTIIPSGENFVREGDVVYFVCQEKDIHKIMRFFGYEYKPVNNILIIGGGTISRLLAMRYERNGPHVKIIEKSPQRCDSLAKELSRAVILEGDGTDQELLQEENVERMDLIISLTGDEETNILTSLLAKKLGAGKAITRIDKYAYFPLVRAIGIENMVSSRRSAVNTILKFMRKGKVLSAASISGDEAEAIEAVAQDNSVIVGKSLMDVDLPKGSLILTIMRNGEIIFPTGSSVIKSQDRVIILSTRKNVDKIEKALAFKPEKH
jgi:trk system potassium uptake protein TrkA